MEIFKNYSLRNHNTFGVNAIASTAMVINSESDLIKGLKSAEHENLITIGEGSNILFVSEYVDKLVILNKINGIKILHRNDDDIQIEAGAGVMWDDLVRFCVKNNFGGIENLSMIPGTVGAAPVQNIGAYGQELKDHFESLTAIEISNHNQVILNQSECNFGYRDSIFKKELKDKVVITSVRLRLKIRPKLNIFYGTIAKEIESLKILTPGIEDVSRIIRKIRTEKLPDPNIYSNAGSFFKNPVITKIEYDELKREFQDIVGYPENENHFKIPAAYLIEKCGLKGLKHGNVGTYPTQPLVVVNYGNATGKEIFEFAQFIKQKVFETFHIQLQEEVNLL